MIQLNGSLYTDALMKVLWPGASSELLGQLTRKPGVRFTLVRASV